MLQDISYFTFYPYDPSSPSIPGNCYEILFSRLSSTGIMFGELHQLYLLANLLGVGERKLTFCRCEIKLTTLLRFVALPMVTLTLGSIIYRKTRLLSNLWFPFTSLLQIYMIRLSVISDDINGRILTGTEPAVTLYSKLAWLQILPSITSFTYRLMSQMTPKKTALRLFLTSIELIFAHLDVICDFLSFLKILVIAENADAKIDVF